MIFYNFIDRIDVAKVENDFFLFDNVINHECEY